MPISVYSSMPRTEFLGTRDDSQRPIAMPVNSLPIHLPFSPIMAPWGEENKARYANAATVNRLYGSEVLDVNSPFFTHQSQFLTTNFQGGAAAMVLRLVDENAKQAGIRFSIDIVADKIPEFERNSDGTIRRDSTGKKIETGETISGYRIRIAKGGLLVNGVSDFGKGQPSDGNFLSEETGETSTLYPFFDTLARFRGAKGNNLGIRLIAPTVNSRDPLNANVPERVGSAIYRLQQIQRQTETSSPTIIPTLQDANFVDFSFKANAKDIDTNMVYDAYKTILPAYEGRTPETFTGWGNMAAIKVYDKHLKKVLEMLAASEEAATGDEYEPDMINFLTGVDVNGVPYHSFIVEGPEEGGILVNEMASHFFVDGADGEVGNEAYNDLVDEMLSTLDDFHVPLRDIAAYPFNSMWDSGFPLKTKEKFVAMHNLRPDVALCVCTQDILEPLNTPVEDSAIAQQLKSIFRAQQESAEYGTKALRFFLQNGAGYLTDSPYDGIVPLLEDTLQKVAAYMGASSGEMFAAAAFGRGDQNTITHFRDHNVISRKEGARNTDWSNGVTYAESYDIDRMFVPGYQSMYETQASVLHSLINMLIVCNLHRVGHIAWRNNTGDSQLTDDEFFERVEEDVIRMTEGKFDNRTKVVPQAYKTKLDDDLGFSWVLDIHAGFENMRTLQKLTVIARRRRDME